MKMIIGGEHTDASDGSTVDVSNPYTGAVIDTVPNATTEDVRRAGDNAAIGQRIWGASQLHERIAVMERWLELLEQHKTELAELLCSEMGKPIQDCYGEVGAVDNWARLTMHHAATILGHSFPSGVTPSEAGDLQVTMRVPRGVCVCICPANYPISGLALNVVPAVLGGNAVLIKPATSNPLTAIRVTDLLIQAGMPPEACQIVTGSGARVGDALVEHPAVASVIMIGSSGVGVQIAQRAARNLAHVTLELGGNDCMIMLDDADMELSVTQAIEGRMYNAGQICCAPKRLLVPRSRKQEFVDRLTQRLADEVVVGDPWDARTRIGTLPTESAAKGVEEKVRLAVAEGAEVVYGGQRNGAQYHPTVIDNVRPDSAMAQDDEIFGPVFGIIEYGTEQEALEIANNTMYGLMSQVMTEDYRRGIRFANGMESGSVILNFNTFSGRTSAQPFGGYKKSGIGRNGISTAIQELTREKTMIFKGILPVSVASPSVAGATKDAAQMRHFPAPSPATPDLSSAAAPSGVG